MVDCELNHHARMLGSLLPETMVKNSDRPPRLVESSGILIPRCRKYKDAELHVRVPSLCHQRCRLSLALHA